jgi:hypothetical protein
MTRREDWAEALAAYIEIRRDMPFEWGAGNDCGSFALGAVDAMTDGVPFDVLYDDAAGAARFVRERGGMVKIATSLFGEPVPVSFARRGDVVLMMLDGRETFGICVGAEVAGPGETGMLLAPMTTATHAWRVG